MIEEMEQSRCTANGENQDLCYMLLTVTIDCNYNTCVNDYEYGTAICHHLHLLMNFLRYYHPSSSRYQEDRNKLWNFVLLPESVLKQFTVLNGSGKRLLLIQEIMVQMQKSHWYNQLGMGSDTYTRLLTNRSSRMTRFRIN